MCNLYNLNAVVMCAINGMEAGDTKKEAVQSITSFVEDNYKPKTNFEFLDRLPISEIEALHKKYNLEFKVHDGRVCDTGFGDGMRSIETQLAV